MIHLDQLWNLPRYTEISGSKVRIPFGIDLPYKLVEFLDTWIKNSGTEWTAKRMKALKVWAIQILAGNHSFSLPWFRKSTYKGYTIPDLRIFKYLIDHRANLKLVRKVLMVLGSYRLGTWGTPSLKTIIEGEIIPPTESYIPLITKYCNLPRVPEFVLGKVVVVDTAKRWADDFGRTHPGPYAMLDEEFPAEIRLLFADMNSDPRCLGRLTAIPDKGKFRSILVGHFAIQLATKKLADWLREWLWTLPEVCSGDQRKMSQFMIAALGKGRTVLSIDLSAATDKLSREFQINLLHHMGVPKTYFKFLELPFIYDRKFFGQEGTGLAENKYRQGQPMGLYISFPMFELAHYVILKFVTATTNADFRILGDDVVIACKDSDKDLLYSRYENLIDRLGGAIDPSKTVISKSLAEGAGCLVMRGIDKEIRIPSGAISPIEAQMEGTWLYNQILNLQPIGLAIASSWLQTKENKVYTHDHRRKFNEMIVNEDHDDFAVEALRYLGSHRIEPAKWKSWEEPPPGIGLEKPSIQEDGIPDPEPQRFKWISRKQFRDNQVSSKIITLFKSKRNKDNTNEE